MSLLQELKDLQTRAREEPAEQAYVFVAQTEDELYADIVEEMRARARSQCRGMAFEWTYHYSEDPEVWEQMRLVREAVVERLRAGGVPCYGHPKVFPKPVWNDWAKEWSPQTGRHYISADWGPGGAEMMRMGEAQRAEQEL